jgi:hypothetical protein
MKTEIMTQRFFIIGAGFADMQVALSAAWS